MSTGPTFVATFADGAVTRMSVYAEDATKPDLERGKKLARYAYESRTGRKPSAFTKAHFEKEDGTILVSYSSIELEDDQETDVPPAPPTPPADDVKTKRGRKTRTEP
jgi:hypothetical protein